MTLIIVAHQTDHIVVAADRQIAQKDIFSFYEIDKASGEIKLVREEFGQPSAINEKRRKLSIWRYGCTACTGEESWSTYMQLKASHTTRATPDNIQDILIEGCHEIKSLGISNERLSQTDMFYSYFKDGIPYLVAFNFSEPETPAYIQPTTIRINTPPGYYENIEAYLPDMTALYEQIKLGTSHTDIQKMMRHYALLIAPYYQQQSKVSLLISADFDLCVQTKDLTLVQHWWLAESI